MPSFPSWSGCFINHYVCKRWFQLSNRWMESRVPAISPLIKKDDRKVLKVLAGTTWLQQVAGEGHASMLYPGIAFFNAKPEAGRVYALTKAI